MYKSIFFRLMMLFVALTFVQILAQQPGSKQRPKIGMPYDVGCTTEKERCKKCRLYELELQFMAGKLDEGEYQSQRKLEELWLTTNCGDTIPPPNDCWGDRNFYVVSDPTTGELTFKVCKNQVVNGECKSTDQCLNILKFDPGSHSRFRREPFRAVLLPTEKEVTAEHLPFNLPNQLLNQWVKASSNPERPPEPFFLVVPHGQKDSVWLLTPSAPGSLVAKATFLPQWKASWFDFIGVKKARRDGVIPFIERLATIFANDPNATLFNHTPINDSINLFTTLHGSANGRNFLVSMGFSRNNFSGTYLPIQHEDGAEFSSLIVPSLAKGNILDQRLISIIEIWKDKKIADQIIAAAPFGSGDTPFRAIGSPVGQSCEEVMRRQLRGGFIDLLMKSNKDYFVWRHGAAEREKVEWFDDLAEHFKPNGFLRLLAIADPKLKVLAASHDVKSGVNKLVFIYSKKPGVVYAWSWKDNQAPSEKTLLRDEQRFELSGESVAPYIASLRTSISPAEMDFLLRWVDQAKNFHLLDLFFNTSPSERILLYSSDLPQSNAKQTHTAAKAHRLAASGTMPDIFLKALGSKNLKWSNFQTLYMANGGWQRKVFIEKLAKTTIKSPEAWLNVERMGIVLGLDNGDARISIHLPEPLRSPFGPVYFSQIRQTIQDDGLIYIIGDAPSHPDELLQNCLQHTWDRQVWRANPLGYFDRCKVL